jgi:hypothetical protein
MDTLGSRHGRWARAWPEILCTACALVAAHVFEWETRDLVWSLWLSSLVIGYATILISLLHSPSKKQWREARGVVKALFVFLVIFGLFHYTLHFGTFHFVHSMILNSLFPLGESPHGIPSLAVYGQVFERYWGFLVLSAVIRRVGLLEAWRGQSRLSTPYRNVIRMHATIILLGAAYFAGWTGFGLYAVAFCAYFFPVHLLRAPQGATGAER